MVNFKVIGYAQLFQLLYCLDPVTAFDVVAEYLIRESVAYWISRGELY